MKAGTRKPIPNHALREARLHHRWSQREVAHRLGTTTNNVSRWELGQTTPGPYFRDRLCVLFGKHPQELGLPYTSPDGEQQEADEPASNSLHTPSFPSGQSTPFWHVPYPRNPFFTGREELLHHLHEMLHREHTMALTQSLAISGLGGIGKTQIALEYVYRYRQNYHYIFWCSAATRETLLAGFVTIAHLLQLAEKDESDQNRVLTAVRQWFATHQKWLLILDNADDVTGIHNLVPAEPSGHLLLTSRAQALGPLAQRIEVGTMGMAEGTLFLLHRTRHLAPDAFLERASEEQLATAEAIVIEMDFLPLALDQAGAYIEEVGCTLAAYLELYRAHRQKLLSRRGHVPSDHPEPVATTWSLNFQQIEQANPAAAELLRLCAFLEPDAIPEELISDGGTVLGPIFQDLATDALALNEAIEELRKFSLVQRDPETRLLRLHRLVQAVLKDTMETEERRQWTERAVRVTNAVFPASVEPATWPHCRRYLPQAQACSALIQDAAFVFAEAASLLHRTASYLRDAALYEQAEPLYVHALRIWEQAVGPDYPDIASSLDNLAVLYRKQGKYEQAEPLFLRALHIWEQAVGHDHPDVASSLDNLALLYRQQGKYEQAEPLFLRALYIWEQAVGPDHLEVASPLDNLAGLYYEQGKYKQAKPLFLRAIHIWEKTLGSNHPKLARSLYNLAALSYDEQGNYEEAEALFLRALHIWEQSLGPDHPEAAYPVFGLAVLYYEQGKYEQAEPLFLQALHIWEQSLGPDHRNLTYSLDGLAKVYHQEGKYEQAESLFQRALFIWEQTLDQGQQHPEVAEVLYDFAALQEAQGNRREAASLYQRALAIREQVLGPDHKHTRETRMKYFTLLQAMGQREEADLFRS